MIRYCYYPIDQTEFPNPCLTTFAVNFDIIFYPQDSTMFARKIIVNVSIKNTEYYMKFIQS